MVRARYTEAAPTEDDPNAVNKVTEVVQLHKQYDGKPTFMKVYMANFQKFIREEGFLVQGYEWLAYPNEVAAMLINYDANWVKKYWNSQVEEGADPREINPRPDVRPRPWGQPMGDMDYVYVIDLPEVGLTTSPPIFINIRGWQAGKEVTRITTKIREGKEPPSKPDMFISLTLVDDNDISEGRTRSPEAAMLEVSEPPPMAEEQVKTFDEVIAAINDQNDQTVAKVKKK